MTNEEYYELISTFKPNFTPTAITCRKYSYSSCNGCPFFNRSKGYCGLYVEKPNTVLPEFYEKALLLTPEKLL
jgi:hypothetical protein